MDNVTAQLTEVIQGYGVKAIQLFPKVLIVIAILSVGFYISGKIRGLTKRALKTFHMEVTLIKFLSNLSSWAFLIVLFLICLGVFGINVTGFATVVGALTVAIGLAFQGTLSNFASGLMLLIFKPFKVGDLVKIADEIGTVKELDIFSTNINTVDNRAIIIPNSLIFGEKIENITSNTYRRVEVKVGVEYSATIVETRAVLEKVVKETKNAEKISENKAFLKELGGSSVNWIVMVWCKTEDYWHTWQDVTQRTKEALDQAGIGIPFPQMELHFNKSLAKYKTSQGANNQHQ